MWVSYFRVLEDNSCYFQYKRNLVKPEYSNNKKNYNISSTYFEQLEYSPFKIYQQNEEEIICFTVNELDRIKDAVEFFDLSFQKTKITLPLKFLHDTTEEKDEFYLEKSMPSCDSSSYQAARSLANSLINLGISISSYWPSTNNKFYFEIESNSVLDAVSDSEIFRFFSTAIFRSVYGKFFISRRNEKKAFSIEMFLKENLEEEQRKKIKKYFENSTLSEDSIKLVYEKPDLNILRNMLEVISKISP